VISQLEEASANDSDEKLLGEDTHVAPDSHAGFKRTITSQAGIQMILEYGMGQSARNVARNG